MNFVAEIKPYIFSVKRIDWRTEIPAALLGALLAIPQAVAFSYLAGVSAEYGIYCAIYVTFITAFFGQSQMMSGPTTATSILLGVLASKSFSDSGMQPIDHILLISLLAGWIQLALWLVRGAWLFDYLLPSATAGITMGVGTLIIYSATKNLYLSEDGWLGIATVVVASLTAYLLPRLRDYFLLFGLIFGILTAVLVQNFLPQWRVLHFLGAMSLDLFQWHVPRLLSLGGMHWLEHLPGGFAIAVVGLAHSLVIAKDIKLRMQPQLNLNREVFALGAANSIAPFMMGFAGCGSFNRTHANEQLSVRTPMAGLMASLIILLSFYLGGEYFAYLPLAVVSGVLFMVGFKMIRWPQLREIFSNKKQALVFLLIYSALLSFGIVSAVVLSIITSAAIMWRQQSNQ